MLKAELSEELTNREARQPGALIEYQGTRGLAIMVGENWPPFLSGDIVVLWEDGEHTVLPEDFELLSRDVYQRF